MRWEAQTLEAFFFTSEAPPADLRIKLSPVLGRLSSSQTQPTTRTDRLSELERLANLRQQGVIDEGEFADLKRQILSRPE